jgi:hypothetical protein
VDDDADTSAENAVVVVCVVVSRGETERTFELSTRGGEFVIWAGNKFEMTLEIWSEVGVDDSVEFRVEVVTIGTSLEEVSVASGDKLDFEVSGEVKAEI